jgi:uncharacterized protein (DUF433 family)
VSQGCSAIRLRQDYAGQARREPSGKNQTFWNCGSDGDGRILSRERGCISARLHFGWFDVLIAVMNESVVVRDPEILSGTPIFASTRVPVCNLLDYVEGGYTLDEFLEDFRGVTKAQVVAFLEQASAKLLVVA